MIEVLGFYPTTVSTADGMFRPALKIGGTTYVYAHRFANEDLAVKHASKVLGDLSDAAMAVLEAAHFLVTK